MKIWAYLAALVVVSGMIGYGVHIVKKANRVDAAEARAEAAEKGRAEDMAKVMQRLDKDAEDRRQFAARMGGIESQFDIFKGDLAAMLAKNPKALVQSTEVPGESCPRVGVSTEFVGMWNLASGTN